MGKAHGPTGHTPGDTLLEVGTVTRPHGIAGEVKVQTSPEYLTALEGVRRVYLGETPTEKRIEGCRVHQGAVLLRLDGVRTRNDAEALRGARVRVRAADLPQLDEGEYYSHDLVGLRVADEAGRELGTIGEVLATGSNDVYVVNTPEGKELLLPAIDSVIRKVDLDASLMEVTVPEGLRD